MKYTLKQVREECRKEMTKEFQHKYDEKIQKLTKDLNSVKQKHDELYIKCRELTSKNSELEEQNNILMDWISRLQDFVNLSDEDREQAIEELKRKTKACKAMADRFEMIAPYFNALFNI